MIEYDWVFPIPVAKQKWTLEMPKGLLYEELILGQIAELMEEVVENATEEEQQFFRSEISSIIHSIQKYTPPVAGWSVEVFNASRIITTSETAPANSWVKIELNDSDGDAVISSGNLQVSVAGTWLIQYSMYVRQTSQAQMRLLVNNVVDSYSAIAFSGNIASAPADKIIGYALVSLDTSDQVSFEIYVRNAATGNIGSTVNYDPAAQLRTLIVSGIRTS